MHVLGGEPTASDVSRAEPESEPGRKSKPTSTTEARREQNRVSSQTYRRRRRQRLALLNQLLEVDAPEATRHSQPEPLAAVERLGEASSHCPLATPWAGAAAITAAGLQSDSLNQPFSQLNNPSLYEQVSEIPANPSIDVGWMAPDLDPQWLDPSTVTRGGTQLAGTSSSLSNLSRVLGSLSSLNLSEKRQVLSLLESDVASHTVSTSSSPPPSHTGPLAVTHTSSALYDSESVRFQIWLNDRTLAPQASQRRLTTSLHLSQHSFWDALVANASVIRLAYVQIVRQDGVSPFTCPQTSMCNTDFNPAVAAESQALVPRDLHPTAAQLKHPHHPYLDLIPFSSFRQRAIDAISADPPLVDWKQLCADINAAGMICWGSGTGGQDGETVNMAFQMPWDARSWEPKAWFLRKYWFLVGGWEDEMWSSARWWATMRNEIISPS